MMCFWYLTKLQYHQYHPIDSERKKWGKRDAKDRLISFGAFLQYTLAFLGLCGERQKEKKVKIKEWQVMGYQGLAGAGV